MGEDSSGVCALSAAASASSTPLLHSAPSPPLLPSSLPSPSCRTASAPSTSAAGGFCSSTDCSSSSLRPSSSYTTAPSSFPASSSLFSCFAVTNPSSEHSVSRSLLSPTPLLTVSSSVSFSVVPSGAGPRSTLRSSNTCEDPNTSNASSSLLLFRPSSASAVSGVRGETLATSLSTSGTSRSSVYQSFSGMSYSSIPFRHAALAPGKPSYRPPSAFLPSAHAAYHPSSLFYPPQAAASHKRHYQSLLSSSSPSAVCSLARSDGAVVNSHSSLPSVSKSSALPPGQASVSAASAPNGSQVLSPFSSLACSFSSHGVLSTAPPLQKCGDAVSSNSLPVNASAFPPSLLSSSAPLPTAGGGDTLPPPYLTAGPLFKKHMNYPPSSPYCTHLPDSIGAPQPPCVSASSFSFGSSLYSNTSGDFIQRTGGTPPLLPGLKKEGQGNNSSLVLENNFGASQYYLSSSSSSSVIGRPSTGSAAFRSAVEGALGGSLAATTASGVAKLSYTTLPTGVPPVCPGSGNTNIAHARELGTAAAVAGGAPPPSASSGAATISEDDLLEEKFHCDICQTDLTRTTMRIRCAECPDFDLCVSCFCRGEEKKLDASPEGSATADRQVAGAVGGEVAEGLAAIMFGGGGMEEMKWKSSHLQEQQKPAVKTAESRWHRNYHKYEIIGRNTQPILSEDWTADEELMLVDGVSKYGFGNWNEVAELVNQVALKPKKSYQCEQHYSMGYLRSSTRPLPDISKFLSEDSKYASKLVSSASSSALPRAPQSGAAAFGSSSIPSGTTSSGATGGGGGSGSSSSTGSRSQQQHQIVGYWPLRGDFDVEYDNDAELILADMEFKEDEIPQEKELKLQIIEIYNSKLDERTFRKKTVIERGLLDLRAVQQKEKKRGKDEKELHNLFKPLARFHRQEEHERFIQLMIEEKRVRARFAKLQEWKSLGLRTLDEVHIYENEKKRREEQKGKGANPFSYVIEGTSQRHLRRNRSGRADEEDSGRCRGASAKSGADFNGSSFGQQQQHLLKLMDPKERELCENLSVAPMFYLYMKKIILNETMRQRGLEAKDLVKIFKLDASRTGQLVDFVFRYDYPTARDVAVNYEDYLQAHCHSSNAEPAPRNPSSSSSAHSASSFATPSSSSFTPSSASEPVVDSGGVTKRGGVEAAVAPSGGIEEGLLEEDPGGVHSAGGWTEYRTLVHLSERQAAS